MWLIRLCSLSILLFPIIVRAQEDSLHRATKPDVFQTLEMEQQLAVDKGSAKTNFEHWMYSQKTHAVVGYLGTIAQGGFSNGLSTATWHYDLGAIYQGKWVKTKNYKLNMHAWFEHTNLVAGSNPKQFAKDLKMFSVPNASDAESAGISLEYLHIENFFFDGLWDVTVGKMEPLFYVTFASYSGWDKLTLFSKTSSSDPVPDMDGAFGFFTEINFSDYFSIGAQILDDNPRNEYFDPGNFFGSTTYNYQVFARWAIPTSKKLYSYHILDFYTYEASADKPSGNGWLYVGNQGVSERLILTMKLSNGVGRIFKYNGAYTAGLIYLNPFNRPGDQTGVSLVINELEGNYEYGLDTFYKLFFMDWITAAVSLQGYYTIDKQIALIPGIRAMITY